MSTMVAGHAVRPVCPHCGLFVRGGVELQAARQELEELILDAWTGLRSATDGRRELWAAVLVLVMRSAEQLEAELAGAHRRAPGRGACDRGYESTGVMRRWVIQARERP